MVLQNTNPRTDPPPATPAKPSAPNPRNVNVTGYPAHARWYPRSPWVNQPRRNDETPRSPGRR